MKYTYKQTGVVVESDIPLDSANFIPISVAAVEDKKVVAASASAIAPAKRTASTRRE